MSVIVCHWQGSSVEQSIFIQPESLFRSIIGTNLPTNIASSVKQWNYPRWIFSIYYLIYQTIITSVRLIFFIGLAYPTMLNHNITHTCVQQIEWTFSNALNIRNENNNWNFQNKIRTGQKNDREKTENFSSSVDDELSDQHNNNKEKTNSNSARHTNRSKSSNVIGSCMFHCAYIVRVCVCEWVLCVRIWRDRPSSIVPWHSEDWHTDKTVFMPMYAHMQEYLLIFIVVCWDVLYWFSMVSNNSIGEITDKGKCGSNQIDKCYFHRIIQRGFIQLDP